MKLHLPKSLLVAVLAACVAPAAWGEWSEDYSNTYCIFNDESINELSTADKADDNGVFIRAGEDSVTASITTLNVTSGKKLTLSAGYPTSSYDLASLTIGTLNIADNGSAELDVGTGSADDMQKVVIKSISGTISALTIGAKGELTIGSASDSANTAYTIQTGTINAEGSLTLAGGTTTIGTSTDKSFNTPGELIVKTGAVLKFVDTDVMDWGSSNKITLDGGKWAVGNTRQSLGGNTILNLSGGSIEAATDAETGATIYGDGDAAIEINSNNVQIKSSGASAITGGIRVAWDRALTIEVLDGTLSVDCIFDGSGSNSGKGTIAKKGAGTLKFTAMGATNNKNETFYKGNTTLSDGGTIEYALASGTGSYTGTISGTGNVAKSGAGSVTLANVSNLEGSISVTEGALNITSLSTDKTMNVSVSGGSLSIGSVEVDELNHQLTDISPEGAADTYFTNDGTAHTTSGFKVEDKTYLLFDGYEWNGEVDGFVVGTQDGDTTLIKSGVGTIYYVNDGEHTISAAGNYINGRATRYAVEQGATLVIDSAQETIVDGNESVVLSAAQLLTSAIGGGNVVLSTSVSLSNGESTQTTGKLTINNGATLTLGSYKTHLVDISDYSSLVLDNGTLELKTATSSFNDVTVTENSGTIKVKDMPDDFESNPHQLTGTTTVTKGGTLSIETSQWRQHLNLHHLTGEGNVAVKDTSQGTSETDSTIIDIASLQGYSGVISLEKNGDAAPMTLTATTGGIVTLSGLTLGADTAAEFINGIKGNVSPGGTLGLGAVKMSGGSQLTLTNGAAERTTDITSLEVTGSATIGTKRHGDCWQGTINLNSLTNTGDSATLTLINGSQIDNATIFNINGGAFKGTINLEANSAKGTGTPNLKLHAYINGESVAQAAVINFQDPSTDTNTDNAYNYITLGVGADTVKIAGLTGTTTNAATIKSTGNSGTRTLEISTTQGADYITNAKVEASVNLVKSGEGTQTFTSDSIDSTSIAVNGGVLALTGLAELQLQDLVVKSGATLSVGNVVATVDEGSSNQTTPSTSVSKTATLHGGATINSSLDLSAASSLTLNGIGEKSLVMINGDLILPVASETPTLTLSGDILSSLNAMNLGDKLGIFSVQGGFFVGDQVTDALDATNGIALSTVFSASEDNNFKGYYLGFIPDEAGYSTVYIGKIAPEPTTATLSLLALAALAARRRRR